MKSSPRLTLKATTLSEVNPSQIASTSTGADLPDISPASGGKAVETSFGFGDCVLQQDSMPHSGSDSRQGRGSQQSDEEQVQQ